MSNALIVFGNGFISILFIFFDDFNELSEKYHTLYNIKVNRKSSKTAWNSLFWGKWRLFWVVIEKTRSIVTRIRGRELFFQGWCLEKEIIFQVKLSLYFVWWHGYSFGTDRSHYLQLASYACCTCSFICYRFYLVSQSTLWHDLDAVSRAQCWKDQIYSYVTDFWWDSTCNDCVYFHPFYYVRGGRSPTRHRDGSTVGSWCSCTYAYHPWTFFTYATYVDLDYGRSWYSSLLGIGSNSWWAIGILPDL